MSQQQYSPQAFIDLYYNEKAQYQRLAQKHHLFVADAEDAVQEAAIKILSAGERFRGECKPQTWFYKIVSNTSKNLRGQLRRKEILISDILRNSDNEPLNESDFLWVANISTPEGELMAKEMHIALMNALKRMSAHLRQALLLHIYDGWDYLRIARYQGVPIGTVRSRIFRAKEELEKYGVFQRSTPAHSAKASS